MKTTTALTILLLSLMPLIGGCATYSQVVEMDHGTDNVYREPQAGTQAKPSMTTEERRELVAEYKELMNPT